MFVSVTGVSHHETPVELREQFAFNSEQLAPALARLPAELGGGVILSTCNRTEFYVMTSSEDGKERLKEWLHQDRDLDPLHRESLFTLQGEDAIRHIFRVACGLDSMVLGEPQILGQLKDAYRQAQQTNALGQKLSLLFQHTFAVAKKIRTDTEIGASPVSVAYAAVHLAEQFFAGFKKHTALLVGAGVTIELVAKHLKRKDIGRLFVANRNISRAHDLANQFGGFGLALSDLEGTLPEADILISSTASPTAVVTLPQMEAAIKARKRKPIFAVDIAVPRDIEDGISKLNDVYLYTIDDLNKVVLEGQGNRESAAQDANRILDEEISRYLNIERAKQVAPLITALRENANSVRGEILKQAQKRLAKGADGQEVLEYATAALMKKMLHSPSVKLREASENSDTEIIAAARALFGLEEE